MLPSLVVLALLSHGSTPRVQLVKDPVLSVFTSMVVTEGATSSSVSLVEVDASCSMLLSAPDAAVEFVDVDFDGADDLLLQAPGTVCFAYWPAWAQHRDGPPLVLYLKCIAPTLCRATPLEGAVQRVVVLKGQRIVQIISDASIDYIAALSRADFTFDGWPDLVVQTGPCTGNCRSTIWPWDPKQKRYVQNAALVNLSNVEVVSVADRLLGVQTCDGQGCAVFHATLLEVSGTHIVPVAEAVRDDLTPGSLLKRMVVSSRTRFASSCEGVFDPSTWKTRSVRGTCRGWPVSP